MEKILCRIITNETNRNQTSIIPVLPQNLEIPAFKYFHSEIDGHLGINKTFHKLKQYFYVPSALTKLKEFINNCNTCNLRKNPIINPNPPMGRTPITRFPFDIISFDLYGTSGGLPTSSKGNTCILSVIGHFSGFSFAKALKNQSAYTTSKALAKLFLNFGIPNTVLSYNGSNFVSKVTKDLMSFLHINKLVTTPYHPQANGKI
jgi:hypothetical protein